jgi:hypothetical protein
MPVVVVEPVPQGLGSLAGVLVGGRVGPLPQGSLDEALYLAIGLPGRAAWSVQCATGSCVCSIRWWSSVPRPGLCSATPTPRPGRTDARAASGRLSPPPA